ncbi:hypothetical protein Tco_0023548, partial [Tanacetum coccineum]
ERIKRTKRSKNSQKPTRNERVKSKSEETAKDQKPDQPDTAMKAVKGQNEVKGPLVTSIQSFKGFLGVIKIKGLKLPKEEFCFIKEDREISTTRTDYAIFKLPL